MIKAIIFDCFGVLVTEQWVPFKKKYFKHDQSLFDEATDLGNQLNSGLINYDQFIEEVADKANISPKQASKEIDDNVANEELFEYIAVSLKPKFKIGMLSNAGDNWLRELFKNQQLELFNNIALSYEIGFMKPNHGAYERIAQDLGVAENECIFVDDQERHCSGARDAGMQAILYKDFDQMKAELEEALAADTKR